MLDDSSIFVISHRRSGTHLLIDLLRNNIQALRLPYISTWELTVRSRRRSFNFATRALRTRVWKTHLSPLGLEGLLQQYDCRLGPHFQNAVKIYVLRDGRDVLVSAYERARKEENYTSKFSTYLREQILFDESGCSRVQAWARHVATWLQAHEALLIAYEDLLVDPRGQVRRIADYCRMTANDLFVDVRLGAGDLGLEQPRNRLIAGSGVQHTSISFREGKAGSWRNYFSETDACLFRREVGLIAAAFEGFSSVCRWYDY